MNVAEVIEELQRLPPHTPVRAVMGLVVVSPDEAKVIAGCRDYGEVMPADDEAQEVTAIRWRGFDVLLDCDGTAA